MSAPRVVPARHWGQWLVAAVLVALVVSLATAVAGSKNIAWSAIPQYILDPTILDGIRLTLLFTVLAMSISILAGVVLAVMRLAANPILSGFSSLYIWFFRGTPLLVQIIFWFNIQLFIPSIQLGGFHIDTNSLISAFTAALLALSLNEAAYIAEIVRSGLLAVDRGQREAAAALGYTPYQSMSRIILPQALRVIVPPIGNQTISMLKTTSLVSVVAAQDLLTRAQNIYARNFLVIELLAVASIWYLVMTTVASIGQSVIERRLGRSTTEEAPAWMRAVHRLAGGVGRNG
jgi:polar amino acid transport system permease protein